MSIDEKIGKYLKLKKNKKLQENQVQFPNTSPPTTPVNNNNNFGANPPEQGSNGLVNGGFNISDSLIQDQINCYQEQLENLIMDSPVLLSSSLNLKEQFPPPEEQISPIEATPSCNNENTELKPPNKVTNFEESITELFSTREKVIIKSLLNFDRENTEPNITHFVLRTPDFSVGSTYQTEKERYSSIELIIKKYFHKYKITIDEQQGITKNKQTINDNALRAAYRPIINIGSSISTSKMDKTLFRPKTCNPNLEFISIKAIIISLINLINEWVGKNISLYFSGENSTDEIGSEIFSEIYNEYIVMCNICSILEQDFITSFDIFRRTYKLNFDLCDLFKDIFWDFIFRVKVLNSKFVNFYGENENDESTKDILKKIVDVLWSLDYPYKKKVAECLSISCILNEKIYLANYICDYKAKLNQKNREINNSLTNFGNNDNSASINNGASNVNNYKNSKIIRELDPNVLVQNEKGKKIVERFKQKESSLPDFEQDNNKSISTNNSTNSINSNNKKINYFESLDDLYNYIVSETANHNKNVSSTNKATSNTKKKGKKKNKKKKDQNINNTNTMEATAPNANSNNERDLVVDMFKTELCTKVTNANDVQKIKPNISNKWIKSIVALNP